MFERAIPPSERAFDARQAIDQGGCPVGNARSQLRRLRRRPVPAWWRDAKLGIMVHWTPASVPAFAPVDAEIGALLASDRPDALGSMPYTEWYENSLRFPDSPVARHHRAVYGDRPYAEFARDWEAGLASWDPDDWARRFAATGARHVVFVAKHSDGYCLWPTDVRNPHRAGWHSTRDVVGEMAEAVRGAGMRFGLYYCGGWDWTFEHRPVGTMADVIATIPHGDYPAYADAQMRELIARYRPSVLWNDVAWPSPAADLWSLFTDYYVAVPDGVVNDRWLPWSPLMASTSWGPVRRAVNAGSRRAAAKAGGLVPPPPRHFDVRTPEYTRLPAGDRSAWECVRGMDRSFGYNASSGPDDFLSRRDLLWLLADVVASGGNLLLNVGPRGVDAQIPDEQLTRLDWLRDWLGPNADAIRATRPWVTTGTTTPEQAHVRYTTRGDTVFALVQDAPASVTLPDLLATPTTAVGTVGGVPLGWQATPAGLRVDVGAGAGAPDGEPIAIACRNVTAAPRP